MNDSSLSALSLHLVGCGNMGSALLKSWLNAGVKPAQVTARVASPASADLLSTTYGIRASTDALYDGEDAVILAVKPQMLDSVLQEHWHNAPSKPLYVTIAAGKTIAFYQQLLGQSCRIIRAMPNTPSLIGRGVTTLVASNTVTTADKELVSHLFSASGTAVWLENETQLDAATAVAGSGPAYVFYFAECLLDSARKLGLPDDVALTLVQGTLGGSVGLADAENWADLKALRRNVTSKGGVTEAALDVLMTELPHLINRALDANIARAKELS